MNRPLRPCSHPGCNQFVISGKCDKHKTAQQKEYDNKRGTASERGYTYRWAKYSKRFLSREENVLCRLRLPGCTNIARCVDHIDPPDSAEDPRFWESSNHQAACIHCNSVKGRRYIKGEGKPFDLQG